MITFKQFLLESSEAKIGDWAGEEMSYVGKPYLDESFISGIADRSLNLILNLPDFKSIPKENVFWIVGKNRVPVFGYLQDSQRVETNVELPLFKNSSELYQYPRESRVGLAKQLKQAMKIQ